MTNYIIITPAYNEEQYIVQTIDSVLSQTVLPNQWIIVDDGSTDNTAQIILQMTSNYPWIRYVYRPKVADQTYYASNVHAIAEGLNLSVGLNYKYLAILDADISLPKDYYERIFARLSLDETLGVVSGVYLVPAKNGLKRAFNDRRFCPKNIMVFRRQCFDDIGGFVPLKYGGEDTCACFMARQSGWKVWSYPDIEVIHNKPVGIGHTSGLLKIRFRQGIGEYFLATHPLFMLFKSIRRCFLEPPFLLGGIVRLMGFVHAHFMDESRQLPDSMVKYIRREQLQRIVRANKIPFEFKEINANEKSKMVSTNEARS